MSAGDGPAGPEARAAAESFGSIEAWGITGGIASGKSTAAGYFAQEGIPVVDADRVARELSLPGGEAYPAIVARFGTADRSRLREIVFADAAARRDLEAILHPMIARESLRRMTELARAAAGGPGIGAAAEGAKPAALQVVLYEAALLVETGRYRQLAGLIVVDSPIALRRERLITRDGLAPELADRILAAQIPDEARKAAATHVLPNLGTLEELRDGVRALMARLGWRRD